MKILIAEDQSGARLLLKTALERLGYEVLAAEDGEQAWALYQQEDARIVILDWMMPELDGLELCRMIRAAKRPLYTYVIMLTVLGGKGSYLEGMKAGADDFVTKPIDFDQLAARLRVAERILGLQAEVSRLQVLLPICSYCKRIRNDDGSWQDLDMYVAERGDTALSHGICPRCYQSRVVPELETLGMDTS